MKNYNLFGEELKDDSSNKYTGKIETPIYEPKNTKPHIEEKMFLIDAARRHNVFNYEKIADYYAHSNPEMQKLMEMSALVIIDFEKAIELGYVKLCEDIKNQYLEDYGE